MSADQTPTGEAARSAQAVLNLVQAAKADTGRLLSWVRTGSDVSVSRVEGLADTLEVLQREAARLAYRVGVLDDDARKTPKAVPLPHAQTLTLEPPAR